MLARACVCFTLTAALLSIAAAGDLDPLGAPVSTVNLAEPRTPITALPATLEAPGSYFLTGNLTMSGPGNGIAIAADHISIDLGGFTLAGAAPEAGDGFWADPMNNYSHVTIRNGIIRDWGGAGINFASTVNYARVEDVQAIHCGGIGIRTDLYSHVINSTAEDCGSHGIQVHGASVVQGCTAANNLGHGILTSNATVVQSCVAYDNTGVGIFATGTITDCTVENNSAGIRCSTTSVVSRCVVEDNTTGIDATGRSTISGCTITDSGSVGINLANNSSVRDCDITVTNVIASIDGVVVASNCRVENNHLRGHVNGSSILVNGDNNRVEANDVSSSSVGIDLLGDNNLVIRNSNTDNTSNINNAGLSNVIGPTVNSANIGTSNSPHANYAH